jgi:hypothetical protein
MKLDWLWVWLIQISSALVCYFLVRSAAKIRLQRFGFALPLTAIATPLIYIVLMTMCSTWNNNPCAYTAAIPGYLFFRYRIIMKSADDVSTPSCSSTIIAT